MSFRTVDREIASRLVREAAESGSGILRCTRGRHKRLFSIVDGRLASALSNVREQQFERRLVENGCLDEDRLQAAAAAAADRGVKPARHLLDDGALDEGRVLDELERHVRGLLFETLDWADGTCEFTRGTPDLRGDVSQSLAVEPLLLAYAATRPESLEDVRLRVGPPDLRPVSRTGTSDGLGRLPREILALCDGTRDIGTLLDSDTGSPAGNLRALYGLILAGHVRAESGKKEEEVEEGAVTRAEVVARLQRAEGCDHYAILELGATAEPEAIRDAYYFLARRYHPDRFRTGPLEDLLKPIEGYFTRVTEAHNTLSDPLLRQAYDEQRTQGTTTARPEQDTRELARQNFAHAKVLLDRGRHQDAVTSLENALSLAPNEARYHMELGRVLIRNPRRRADAEEHLRQATTLDPSLVDGYVALGDLLAKTGRTDEASDAYRQALQWEPGYVAAEQGLKGLKAVGKKRGLFGG